jgi:hypothetical protein
MRREKTLDRLMQRAQGESSETVVAPAEIAPAGDDDAT